MTATDGGWWDQRSLVPLQLEGMDGDGETVRVRRLGWGAPELPRAGDVVTFGKSAATVTGIQWEVAEAGGVPQLQRVVVLCDLGPYSAIPRDWQGW